MAAHDYPSLGYADYFAAAGGGGAALVHEVDAGDEEDHLYGAHQPGHGVEMFGVRGLLVPEEMNAAPAHGKAASLGDFVVGDHAPEHHRQGHLQVPLTSLSFHGPPAEAASLAIHHHHQQQLASGGAHRQHQLAAWPQPEAWHLPGSRFLRPTQQLLQEFCSLPMESTSPAASKPPTKPVNEEGGDGGTSSSPAPSAQLQAMDSAELQRLKAKLYTLLDEVDRRYRRYREQMKAVAGSFEAVAGERAAAAYTRLASRTISRHFRALRDGVSAQIQAVRRALGEKDTTAGEAAKGETTPRLRALEQCLRQHRAYQAGVIESQPWRPQRRLPERAVSVLRAWLFEHFLHPYPSDVDKQILARQTGLSRSQVSNWFINARVRLWKPMVEEMYEEEMKDDPKEGGAGGDAKNPNPSSSGYASEGQRRHGGASGEDGGGGERKPTRAQLLVHDAGSLASVVGVGSSRDQQSLSFGMMDHLDFDAYNDGDQVAAARGQGLGGGGGTGVTLTLGLQQQHGDVPHAGVNVAFAAPAAAHEFIFMAGGEQQQMVAGGGAHGHHGQFGAGMEGDAASHYHHRSLSATGFQLLHDLAG